METEETITIFVITTDSLCNALNEDPVVLYAFVDSNLPTTEYSCDAYVNTLVVKLNQSLNYLKAIPVGYDLPRILDMLNYSGNLHSNCKNILSRVDNNLTMLKDTFIEARKVKHI
jgi:hypothetical protein